MRAASEGQSSHHAEEQAALARAGDAGSPGVSEIGYYQVMFEWRKERSIGRTCFCKGFSAEKRWREGERNASIS
jgi:hypothetical protein